MKNPNKEIINESVVEFCQIIDEQDSLKSFFKTNDITPETIIHSLHIEDIIKNLDTIAKVCDINQLINEMSPCFVIYYHQELMKYGGIIDFQDLVKRLNDSDIAIYLEEFMDNGLDGQALAMKLEPISASICIPTLQERGIDIDFLKDRSDWSSIEAAYKARFPEESI